MIIIKALRKKSLTLSLVILMSSLAIPYQAFSDCPDFVVTSCINRQTMVAKPAPEGLRIGRCYNALQVVCQVCNSNDFDKVREACAKQYGGTADQYETPVEIAY